MLLFKRKFLPAIRSGQKTQTIRLWKRRQVKAGQRSHIPGIGPIRITQVEAVCLEALTDEDARPDGFESADALRAEICRLYSESERTERQSYRIRFQLLAEAEENADG